MIYFLFICHQAELRWLRERNMVLQAHNDSLTALVHGLQNAVTSLQQNDVTFNQSLQSLTGEIDRLFLFSLRF
jgi:FtsZ-binding cell division protein ZapB